MVFCNKYDYVDRKSVRLEYPGAARIIIVEGGWMVFHTHDDYNVWNDQK